MSGRGLALAVVAVAALLAAYWVDASGNQPSTRATPLAPAATAEPPQLHRGADPAGGAMSAEWLRPLPRGASVRFDHSFDPHDFTAGIGCPGGGFLPLLNGVPHAQPLQRNVELLGPVPPVVGKYTDADGDEWWVHADGSETTSRFTTVTVGGVSRRDVRTDHVVPAPPEHGLPPARTTTGR